MNRYEEIYAILKDKINTQQIESGTYLPSENELRLSFQVSRDTIRKSLSLLEEHGFIQKIQGKGSLVLTSKKIDFPIAGLTSYKELETSLGFHSQTKVIQLEQLTIDHTLHRKTKFTIGTTVWHLLRTRKINGEVRVLDEDYFLCDVVPTLSKQIAKDSVYNYFEHTLHLRISFAQKEITITPLTDKDKTYLSLPKKDINVVCVASHVHLSDGSYFQYSESHHQVDSFQFVEFARRQKI